MRELPAFGCLVEGGNQILMYLPLRNCRYLSRDIRYLEGRLGMRAGPRIPGSPDLKGRAWTCTWHCVTLVTGMLHSQMPGLSSWPYAVIVLSLHLVLEICMYICISLRLSPHDTLISWNGDPDIDWSTTRHIPSFNRHTMRYLDWIQQGETMASECQYVDEVTCHLPSKKDRASPPAYKAN